MLQTDWLGQPVGGWLLNFFDAQKVAQIQGLRFDTDMPSAVASLPIKVNFGWGPRDCTMVGGSFAYARDTYAPDRETRFGYEFVQPETGWVIYYNKPPETPEMKEDVVVEEQD
ncbi:hypothetical protein FCOIX_1610 [Fusarium coicis]|nr:hypothetical protein FCOIX_1610 [Fusarium coicis]